MTIEQRREKKARLRRQGATENAVVAGKLLADIEEPAWTLPCRDSTYSTAQRHWRKRCENTPGRPR